MLLVQLDCAGVVMRGNTVQRLFGSPQAAAASGAADDDIHDAQNSGSSVQTTPHPPKPATVFLLNVMDELVQHVFADELYHDTSKICEEDLRHLQQLVKERLSQHGFHEEAETVTVE